MSSRKVPAESLTGSKRAKIENANAGICQFLNELAEYEKNVNRQIHKHNVYRKASRTIAAHPTALQSGKEAQSLPGVGAKIAKKIDEFLSTGKLSKLENIHADPKAQAIQLIASIVGFGPAAASKFVEQGITTLEELRKQDGLTSTQRIGLTYFEDFQKRIPREEVTRLSEQALKYVAEVDSDLRAEVCGSYRRGASSSGDIDILMTHPKFTSEDKKNNKITNKDFAKTLSSVVEAMKDAGFVTDSLSCGETKFMGVCVDLSSDSEQIHRRIDIRFWPFDQPENISVRFITTFEKYLTSFSSTPALWAKKEP
eukprot:gene10381-2513_t